MRVAIDLTPVITGSTGVARYATQLARALANEGVELSPFAVGRAAHPVPAGVRHVGVPLRVVQRSWALARRPRAEGLAGPVDLVHSLDLRVPPSACPSVATIHDLVALEHPGLHPRRAVAQQRARLAALAGCQVVITDSRDTAEALVRRGVARDRIAVAALGLTVLPPPVDPPVAGPFLLAVGELAPRKGYAHLVQALGRAGLGQLPIVLAGPDGGHGRDLAAMAERLGMADRVVLLGPVDDATLAGLYRDAVALCFPSLAEGFGLPVLEAMAAGLPVLASDLAVVREVAGEAALLVSPGDTAAWMVGLDRMVRDGGLRRRLVDAGAARAARFTWAATARATIDAYRKALSSCG